jgi:excisionase family DNA binding protein
LRTTTVPRLGLSTAEAARRLGVHKGTIYRLIENGQLPAARISPRGDYRISVKAIDRLLDGNEF